MYENEIASPSSQQNPTTNLLIKLKLGLIGIVVRCHRIFGPGREFPLWIPQVLFTYSQLSCRASHFAQDSRNITFFDFMLSKRSKLGRNSIFFEFRPLHTPIFAYVSGQINFFNFTISNSSTIRTKFQYVLRIPSGTRSMFATRPR